MGVHLRLVVLVLLAAAPVFVIDIVAELDRRAAREVRLLDAVQALAGVAAARQDRFVEGARLLLTATARLEAVRTHDPDGCHRELRVLAQNFPELTGMSVIAPDGTTWCTSAGAPVGFNVADRPYFQAALTGRRFAASGFLVGRQTGRGSLAMIHPVVDPESGDVASLALLAFDTAALSRALNDPPLPEGAFVMLVDRQGMVVARWPEPERWVGHDLSQSAVVRAAAGRRGAIRATPDGGSEPYAIGFAPMQPPTELTVLLGQNLAPVLREAEAAFWREIALTTFVFLLAALAAVAAAHWMVARPIGRLRAAVAALERGAPAVPVAGGITELRQLGEQFAAMAGALGERQTQLSEALHQKELLLQEVDHRVKNSLQLVASMLGLQRRQITDPEIRRHFDDASRRIHTIALVHRRLYQGGGVSRVAFDDYLRELCRDLQAALGAAGKVELACEAAPCALAIEEVVPTALIVSELVTNAFKYAYRGDASGRVHVRCHPEPAGAAGRGTGGAALVVEVADDGVALPEGFDLEASDGLGMTIVTGLARQLNATLAVVPRAPGKAFVLRLPVKE